MNNEEWEIYMFDKEIVRYRLSKVKFINYSKSYDTISLKDRFLNYTELKRFLSQFFYKSYLDYIDSELREFYLNNLENKVNEYYLNNLMHLEMIGKSYHKRITPQTIVKYIRKGARLNEAQELMHQKCKDLSPRSISFYTKRGFTKEEAKKIISDSNRQSSKFCKEYWINLGFTSEEAETKRLKEINSTLISKTTRKYWERFSKEELKQILKDYIDKFGSSIVKEKKYIDDIDKIIHCYTKTLSKYCKEYWMSKGFPEYIAIKRSLDELWKTNPLNKEKWIRDGYSLEEAIEKFLNMLE